jgi:hypothetical protein
MPVAGRSICASAPAGRSVEERIVMQNSSELFVVIRGRTYMYGTRVFLLFARVRMCTERQANRRNTSMMGIF